MSGRRIADLLIKIGADSYEFQSKSQQVQSDLDKFGKKVDKIGKELSLKLTAPLAALGAVSVAMFDDSARAMAKVEQGIKSTGGAAQLSSAQFAKLASELQNKTLFEDDFILNNATAQLLTFTNIAGENFKRAQAVALDLATVLDSDLKGASIQLGKALNDPVRSLSALRKSGIQFSDEQEAVIKKLAATGDTAKAQSLMLTELERQYGGQAEAAAKVGAGSLKQLKNSWGDFLEQIGAAIMPALNALVDTLKKVVNWLQSLSPETKSVIVTFAGIAAAVGPAALALGGFIRMLPMMKAGFVALTSPIGLLITALSVGITLFASFGRGANDSAEANGKLTTKIIEESRQVNLLIGRLSSANKSEKERQLVLEELEKIQPSITEGLSSEKLELKELTLRASEYNKQLVLRIALARKQDQVAEAIERQTDAGINQATKEADLYEKLAKIQSQVAFGKIEIGQYNAAQGITRWREITQQERQKITAEYTAIMSSGDDLSTKAQKIHKILSGTSQSLNKGLRGVDTKGLRYIIGQVSEASHSVDDAAQSVKDAESGVRNFAEAFSLSIDSALDGAEKAADTIGIIEGLTEKLKTLEDSRVLETDAKKLAEINSQIINTRKELAKYDVSNIEKATGKIALLGQKITELTKKRDNTNDINLIAHYNSQIEATEKEMQNLILLTEKWRQKKAELSKPIAFGTVKTEFATFKNPIDSLDKHIASGLKHLNFKEYIPVLKIDPMIKFIKPANEITQKVSDYIANIYGNGGIEANAVKLGLFIKKQIENNIGKGFKVEIATDMAINAAEKIGAVLDEANAILSSNVAQAVSGIAQSIGGMLVGDLGFDNLLQGIASQVGNFFIQLGELAIKVGTTMKAFQEAMTALVKDPFIMIAIGAGMVILGTVLNSMLNQKAQQGVPKLANGGLAYGATYAMVGDNPNARVDPEVIAPLSKLKQIMKPNVESSSMSNVKFVIEGDVLVGILNKYSKKLKYT